MPKIEVDNGYHLEYEAEGSATELLESGAFLSLKHVFEVNPLIVSITMQRLDGNGELIITNHQGQAVTLRSSPGATCQVTGWVGMWSLPLVDQIRCYVMGVVEEYKVTKIEMSRG